MSSPFSEFVKEKKEATAKLRGQKKAETKGIIVDINGFPEFTLSINYSDKRHDN